MDSTRLRRERLQVGQIVKDYGPHAVLLVVCGLSAAGGLYQPPRPALAVFLGLSGGSALAILAIRFRREDLSFPWLTPLTALLGLVIVNLAVQLSGGPDSPLYPFYFLLFLVPAVAGRVRWSVWLAAGAFVLEVSSSTAQGALLLFWSSITVRMALFIFFAWLVGDFFLHQRLLATVAGERLSRIESKVRSLGVKRLDVEEDETIEVLGEEGGQRRIVAAAHVLEAVLQSLADSIFRSFTCHTVGIFLVDRDAGTLVLRAHRSHSGAVVPEAVIDIGSGVVGWVAKEEKHLIVENLGRSSRSLGYYSEEPTVHSFAAVPIAVEGRREGVLAIDSEERGAFGWEERARLEQFAEVASHIISYARSEAQSALTVSQLSALYGMAHRFSDKLRPAAVLGVLADAAQRIVGCERLSLSVVDTGAEKARIIIARGLHAAPMEDHEFSLTTGLVGWVARHRRPLLIPDLTKRRRRIPVYSVEMEWLDVRSFLGVPLIVEDRCIGVLGMEHRAPGFFTDSMSEVVSLIVAQASVAVNRAELYEEMEKMAIHDGLTGLLNHRRFGEVFELEIERSRRSGKPVTLLMLDLDHFKVLNDRFGHPAGDAVLREIATILRECVRTVDSLARYGGEEFAIVLVETDLSHGLKIAERIRGRIEARSFLSNETIMTTSASIGVATFPRDAQDGESLIACADRALYLAKHLGRNQVRCAEEVRSEL
jgi:two-component system cell cycle response regulator